MKNPLDLCIGIKSYVVLGAFCLVTLFWEPPEAFIGNVHKRFPYERHGTRKDPNGRRVLGVVRNWAGENNVQKDFKKEGQVARLV